ncbi:hypothetical protein F4827_005347 [Paraburkholderia bannensis]|uniref:Pilus assembly protein n=1 Tax=Paraburkholderia bannensis TaxID=765414 RepID=A0A7W9WTM4_9BURK|nr:MULTISPECIES: hypothetical protein [Paraburkholderia]MBB3260444.1 hypothetical protein [Paraburkholderia sp. WP4_3_2]MBB6105480.1 hypothetical protein [Paraburkholderia bannensis]
MSDLSSDVPRMSEPPFSRAPLGEVRAALLHGWRPLHAWSTRRRAVVALTLGCLAAVLTAIAYIAADVGGAQTAHVALADAQARQVAARQTLARLPALRIDARDWPQRPHKGSAASDMRNVSQLAAQAGLALIALEPVTPDAGKAQAFRATRLVAQGSFAQLRGFLDGLAELPELAVPMALSLRRSASGLAVSAQLQVFDGLPAVAFAGDANETGKSVDPFSERSGSSPGEKGDGALRLAGTLAERGRAVALIETAEGTTAVQAGATIVGARVLQVTPARVVLSVDGAIQTLDWAQEKR